jgi:hypothetical protein
MTQHAVCDVCSTGIITGEIVHKVSRAMQLQAQGQVRHLHDELQLVLAALEHALEGLGGHEQQHAGQAVVQDDRKVVDVHAADDQDRVPGAAAIQGLQFTSQML